MDSEGQTLLKFFRYDVPDFYISDGLRVANELRGLKYRMNKSGVKFGTKDLILDEWTLSHSKYNSVFSFFDFRPVEVWIDFSFLDKFQNLTDINREFIQQEMIRSASDSFLDLKRLTGINFELIIQQEWCKDKNSV